jgi:hypothetical protein
MSKMKCGASDCQVHSTAKLAIIDDGTKRFVLCPEHQIEYALALIDERRITSFASQLEEHECEICCSPANIYADDVELYLCRRHLNKLIRHHLNPTEYTILRQNHSEFQLLVGDLYSTGGYALQPIYESGQTG